MEHKISSPQLQVAINSLLPYHDTLSKENKLVLTTLLQLQLVRMAEKEAQATPATTYIQG
jgi:hypothetical protein